MDVAVVDAPQRHRYEALAGDELAGVADYRLHATTIELLHTEVEAAYERHGVGSTLARGVLDDARARGLAVLPFCPFMRGYIDGHREYVDLVPEGRRARFRLDR